MAQIKQLTCVQKTRGWNNATSFNCTTIFVFVVNIFCFVSFKRQQLNSSWRLKLSLLFPAGGGAERSGGNHRHGLKQRGHHGVHLQHAAGGQRDPLRWVSPPSGSLFVFYYVTFIVTWLCRVSARLGAVQRGAEGHSRLPSALPLRSGCQWMRLVTSRHRSFNFFVYCFLFENVQFFL